MLCKIHKCLVETNVPTASEYILTTRQIVSLEVIFLKNYQSETLCGISASSCYVGRLEALRELHQKIAVDLMVQNRCSHQF